MPVTRKLIAQDQEESQILKVDNNTRYLVNEESEWQILFGQNAAFTGSTHVLKIGAEFDAESFDGIRLTSYLYNTVTGNVDSAGTCTFNVYVVRGPEWNDVLVNSFSGTIGINSHFFKKVLDTQLPGVDLFGADTLMIESVVTRLSDTYRERLYVNHLGVYANITQVRQDVDFLEITKVDE